MTPVIEQTPTATTGETYLVAEVRRILAANEEPLTLSKIRAQLPAPLRGISLDDLAESLRRQVAANVVIPYPRYRSQQDRFWDRPMPVHIAHLLRTILAEGPLVWSELRRKLPAYAQTQAEAVLQEQLAQGRLYRHPRAVGRGKERYGAEPADPKEYLRSELTTLFHRLEQLGFSQEHLRAGALELLHEEEWGPAPLASPADASPSTAPQGTPARDTAPEPPAERAAAPAATAPPQAQPPVPGTSGGEDAPF